MGKIGDFLAGLLGSAIGLAAIVVGIFGLPLNVIALMRWLGWEWWGALLAAVGLFIIPVVGRVAYFVFAIVGAYFFFDAGFDWRVATGQLPKTVSAREMSPEEFERFKAKVVAPDLERQCKEDVARRAGMGGKLPQFASDFCECYVRVAMKMLTLDEIQYQEQNHRPSPSLGAPLESAVMAECRS